MEQDRSPLRVFVAIPLPGAVRSTLSGLARTLSREVSSLRPVAEASLHITLRFIGDVASREVGAIVAALRQALVGEGRFRFVLRGVGVFPNERRARVLWVGAADTAGLERLAAKVRAALAGVVGDEREFRGHVTIGRFRDSPRGHELAGALGSIGDREFATVEVSEVVLFESRLRPTGAEHLALARLELGGGA